MKFINKTLIILSICLFAFGCEETEFERFGQNYVSFDGGTASFTESASLAANDGTIQTSPGSTVITVFRSSEDLSSALTVNIAVAATFVDNGADASSNFVINKDLSSLQIAAGEVSTSFTVVAINDDEVSGNINVSFNIMSTSDNTYALGQQSTQIGRTFALTISDDDCPLDLSTFAGTYDVTLLLTNGFLWAGGAPVGVFTSQLSPGDNPGEFVDSNPFGVQDGGVASPESVVLTVDEATASVSVVAQQKLYVNGSGLQRFIQTADGLTGGPVFSTCGPDFTLNYHVYREDETSIATTVTATYTRVN